MDHILQTFSMLGAYVNNFGLWVIRSLSTPVPGVVYVDTAEKKNLCKNDEDMV